MREGTAKRCPTQRATWRLGVVGEIRMGRGPGAQLEADAFQQKNILGVIFLWVGPTTSLSRHSAQQRIPAQGEQLSADTQIIAEVIKLIGPKLEVLPRNLEGVYRFIRVRSKPVNQQATIRKT